MATFAVPFLAGDMGALYLSRAAVGLGDMDDDDDDEDAVLVEKPSSPRAA